MLQLLLPKGYTFNVNDFGTNISFKIYNEDDTVFNATSYNAPLIHCMNENGDLIVNEITGTWDTQNQGVGHFAFTSTNRNSVPSGKHENFFIQVQLTIGNPVTTLLTTELKRIFFLESSASA